jgi:heme/copper-type cytochrome/quinol oxidase subunit 4
MKIEDERKAEKNSFRKEFRMWLIGFLGTVILTAAVTWVTIHNDKINKQAEIREIVTQTIEINHRISQDTTR